MRHIIAASLLFSPMLCTAAAVASTPATDDSAITQALRVSTGVIPAHVIRSASITLPNSDFSERIPNDAEVVLKLNVDEQGIPADIQVVKSINPELGAKVAEAVHKFRFSPATLDNQAIPTTISLTVVVQH